MPDSVITLTAGEVSAYYATRIPRLRQTRAAEWRGPCVLHGGKHPNFAVSSTTGYWFCFSQCGRGGDVFGFEMTLTGARFPDAKRAVFDIIGRPNHEERLSPADRTKRAEEAARRRSDLEHAELWRSEVLRRNEKDLAEAKSLLFFYSDESIAKAGARVNALTAFSNRLAQLRSTELLEGYYAAIQKDSTGTRQLVQLAGEREQTTQECTASVVRLLEASLAEAARRDV